MKHTLKMVAAAAGLAAAAGTASAALVNPGFESGLTGWTTNLSGGTAAAVTSNSTTYLTPATYLPEYGSYFLAIQSGFANVWQEVFQAVTLAAGQTISGRAAFDWGDYIFDLQFPDFYKDGAKVEIRDAAGNVVATPFYLDGSLICSSAPCPPGVAPSGYNGPWTDWSFTASAAGTYTVVYAARNTGDGGGPNQTFGYFDAVGVPEPGTIALLGIALAGLGFSRRAKARRA